MSNYEFWRLICLENIDPTKFGGRNYLVSVVQRQGKIKKYGHTTTTNVSARNTIEKKRKYRKRNMETYQSILNRKSPPKMALATQVHRVNEDALQPVCALARRLNHDNPHWKIQ